MSNRITVPALGESVTEATVSKWLKSVGQKVDTDEPLVELETDKVNVEVPSPLSGVLEKIAAKEGDTVQVGAFLGSVSEASSKIVSGEKEKKYTPPIKEEKTISLYEENEKPKKINKKKKSSTNGAKPLILEEIQEEPVLLLQEEDKIKESKTFKKKKIVSPSARKIAQERNIDLNEVKGSGKHGAILKGDLLELMGFKPSPNVKRETQGPEERIRMTRLRLTIAKRLKEAQNEKNSIDKAIKGYMTLNNYTKIPVDGYNVNYKKRFMITKTDKNFGAL